MENKQIAKLFIENLFIDNDKAYSVLADDVCVSWPGFGMDDIVGRENLRKFLDEGGPDKIIEQKVNNIIAEGDTVIGEGSMVTERNGKVEKSHFADVYTIKNGKITHLKSYMVIDQSNKNTE